MFGAADRHAVFRQIARIAVLVLAAGLACSLLVRYAPGTMVDERELDRRLSEESIRELRAEKAQSSGVFNNLGHYLRGLTRGDLGYSQSNNASIASLIADRAPTTLRELSDRAGRRVASWLGAGDPPKDVGVIGCGRIAAQRAYRADCVSLCDGRCKILFGVGDRSGAENFPVRPQPAGASLQRASHRNGAGPRRKGRPES